jgi:hypothetical protein
LQASSGFLRLRRRFTGRFRWRMYLKLGHQSSSSRLIS